jgi:hypothetical protein
MVGVSRVCANPATGTLLVLSALELPPEALEATLAATLHEAVAAPIACQSPRWPQSMRTTLTHGLLSVARVLRSNGASPQPTVSVEVFGATRLGVDAASNHTTSRPPASADSQPLWHRLELERILGELGVHGTHGLSMQDAAARLATDGANVLLPAPRRSELRILLDQLTSVPVGMLGISALLSALTGGISDAVAILAVLGVNAAIGYATESGAERTIDALTHTPQPAVPVLRDGAVCDLPVEQLVRGDVLVLRAGVFVAADARLARCSNLTVDESSLTGESMPVAKSDACLASRRIAVRLALYVDDVRMVQKSIHGRASKQSVAEQWWPFFDVTVRGDHDGAGLVADADEFVEIGWLIVTQGVKAKIVQDQKIDRRQA